MKALLIYRGLPGSGKSHAIARLDKTVCICSADHFFIKDGAYQFYPHLIAQAHAACQEKALRAMNAGVAMVVIDNTNVQRWEFAIYLVMAEIFGYKVQEVVVGGHSDKDVELYDKRNVHGVPEAALYVMANHWEE